MTPVPAGSVPAAATFREETPARDIPAWRLSRGEEDGLARRSLAPITLADPTLETELDGPAVSAARHAAEVVRTKILADADGVFREELRMERLQQACLAEVERKRTKHRFEQLIQLSADAGQVLSEAWEGSRDRMHKDASRELGQDMLVLGLFNPMTLRDIDLAEFVTVARLRRSAKRRDIVAGEIARRVHEEVPTALHQYGMTRAFVDRVAAVAVVAGSAEDALRTVLEERADESIEQVTSEVMRRHGIWLPGLRDRLLQRLRPLIEGILSLMP